MNIELRPFLRSDFPELISWIRTPKELFLWSATTFTFPLDENQLEKHDREAQGSNARLTYTVVDGQTMEQIGHIELTRIDREKRRASIAYVLVDPAKRGLGCGQAMIQSILKECFQPMEMEKVDLFVFQYNTTAVNLYQKIGFAIEEVLEDRIEFNGKFVPLYLMGLTHDRWITYWASSDP